MASHITLAEAKSWIELTKLVPADFSVDTELERQVSQQVFARLQGIYQTNVWLDAVSTPDLVRSIIAMLYCAWIYDRAYSDDDDDQNTYADTLRRNAETLLAGLIDGSIDIPDISILPTGQGQPAFFPNDTSSALSPTEDNPSDGAPAFLMGAIW